MNTIELTAYRATVSTLTGAGFREAGMPFPSSFPVSFTRHFEDGKLPEGYPEHMGQLVRPLFDTYGLNVEVHCLSSNDCPRKTVVVKLW